MSSCRDLKLKDIDLLSIGNQKQITGVIYSDSQDDYLVYFPDEEECYSKYIMELDAKEWQKFLRQTDLMETEVLAKTKNGKITKAILRKSARQIDQKVSWQVYRRDKYKCRYCGNDKTPLTVDHLVLWEKGGPSTLANLVACCRSCNRARGNMEFDQWIESDYYKKVSKNICANTASINALLAQSLDAIERKVHVRSR